MEVDPNNELDRQARRRRSLLVLIVSLLAVALCMGVLLAVVLRAAGESTGPRREVLGQLGVIVLAAMFLLVILAAVSALRYYRLGIEPKRREPTPYVDAWSLAGQRFKLEDEDEEEEDDDEDNGEPKGKGPEEPDKRQ